MLIKDINDASAKVGAFQSAYKDSLSAQRAENQGLTANNRTRTYQNIAAAYELAMALLANPDVLGALLTNWNEKAAGEKDNPFGPIVRILFRTPKKDGGTKANKSAWKYGGVLRYCRDEGWEPAKVPEELGKLEVEIDGIKRTKLLAAELADRQRYNVGAEDRQIEEFAFQHLMDQDGVEVPISGAGAKDGDFISVALSWSASKGRWIVRETIVTNSAKVRQSIRDKVLTKFKEYSDKLMIELASHNLMVESLEAEASEKKIDPARAMLIYKAGEASPAKVGKATTKGSKIKAENAVAA